jgi:3-hydroxyisobutyrate dehydrogenase
MIAALAEAFHLADRFGLDREQFASVIGGGQLASPISRVKAQKLAAGDFAVQAAVSDALKNMPRDSSPRLRQRPVEGWRI